VPLTQWGDPYATRVRKRDESAPKMTYIAPSLIRADL
jgi:hypothetical protein